MTDTCKVPKWAVEPLGDMLTEVIDLWDSVSIARFLTSLALSDDDVRNKLNAGIDLSYRNQFTDNNEFLTATGILSRNNGRLISKSFGYAIVAMWSLLEECTKDLLKAWLRNSDRSMMNINELKNIKLDAEDLLDAGGDQYWDVLAKSFKRRLEAPTRKGIAHFDDVLAPIGFDYPAPKPLAKAFEELAFLRNSIAHCHGKADKDLVTNCPWLELKIGDDIAVTPFMIYRYGVIIQCYVVLLMVRTSRKFGDDATEIEQAVISESDLYGGTTPDALAKVGARHSKGTSSGPPEGPEPSATV